MVGAVKNAILAARIYPEFIARFYFGSDVPRQTITTLGLMPNVEMFKVDGYHGQFSNAWRFLAFSDPDVEIALMRDADARLTARERMAVDEWIASGLKYHSMKDHPTGHRMFPINAGMWGGYTDELRHMKELMQDFRARKQENSFAADQLFLARYIAPIVHKNMMIHDTFNETEIPEPSIRKSFPVPLANFANHVGAAMDEDDLLVYAIDRKMSISMGGNGYFQYDIPVPELPYPVQIPAEKSTRSLGPGFHDERSEYSDRQGNRPPKGAFVKATKASGGIESPGVPGAFDRKVPKIPDTIDDIGTQWARKPIKIESTPFSEISSRQWDRKVAFHYQEFEIELEKSGIGSGQWDRKPIRQEEEKVPKEVTKPQWDKKNRPLR
jgi:hypothetical protein